MENVMDQVYTALETGTREYQAALAVQKEMNGRISSGKYEKAVIEKEIIPAKDAASTKAWYAREGTLAKVRKMVEDYKKDIRQRDRLNPAELTADAELLKGGYPLTQEDLVGITRRSKGNRTMCNLIVRYADAHGLNAGEAALELQAEKDHARNILEICRMYERWMDKPEALEVLKEFFGKK